MVSTIGARTLQAAANSQVDREAAYWPAAAVTESSAVGGGGSSTAAMTTTSAQSASATTAADAEVGLYEQYSFN